MTDALAVDRHGAVAVVTLDDGKANALSAEVIRALGDAVVAAERDADVAALVIAGRPGVFSGGFDLAVMRSGDLGAIVGLVADGGDLVHKVFGTSIPVVGACTGHAVAAGALLLLGCDVRVGAEGPFTIGLNEVAIGMVLPTWAETIASARLARPHYHRAVFNARLTDPAGAAQAGFLDRVVAADDVIAEAIDEAAALGALDGAAYRGSISQFRTAILDEMAAEIAADRAAVSAE